MRYIKEVRRFLEWGANGLLFTRAPMEAKFYAFVRLAFPQDSVPNGAPT